MKTRLLIFSLCFMIFSCGPSTKIIGSWTKEDLSNSGPYEKVFIAALTANPNVQSALEINLASAARQQGVEAITSGQSFSRKFTQQNQPSKEEILDRIKAEGADAIFTVSLLDKESETRYVPGSTTYYRPITYAGYYGRFYSYYNTRYPVIYEPGYYETDKIYYLESNLYDAGTEELIWSAQSKTVNPYNIESFARDYTEAMIKELMEDGILKE